MALGKKVVGPAGQLHIRPKTPTAAVNTRNALWPTRWPAIALQSCIDEVEAAEPADQEQVKRNLPCFACPKSGACLNAKRKEIGPLLYDREILTQPRSSESSLFPFERMAPMLDPDLAMVPYWHKPEGFYSRYVVVSGWDIAWSERVGGDRLVRTTAQMDLITKKRRLLNMHRYPEGLKYSQQMALIEQAYRSFREDLIVIETDAAQVIWAQTLEEKTDLPVFRHAAGGDKKDLRIGVPGLLIDFDNQRWELPYMEHGLGYDEMRAFLAELEAFGWVDGQLAGVGEHDDMVMSFWHCSHGLKIMSNGFGEMHVGTQTGRSEP